MSPPSRFRRRQITTNAAHKAGVGHVMDEDQHQQLTLAAHFGYGAAAGAALAPVAAAAPIPPVATGIAFGLAIRAASYKGWLPATGLRHDAKHDPPARNVLMIAAHIVWGLTAGLLIGAQARRR